MFVNIELHVQKVFGRGQLQFFRLDFRFKLLNPSDLLVGQSLRAHAVQLNIDQTHRTSSGDPKVSKKYQICRNEF